MSKKQTGAAPPQRGQRHALLFQQRMNEMIFWPAVLIMGLIAALLVWNPPKLTPYLGYVRVVLAGTGLILVVTFLFRLRAYAQCLADELVIQVPFQRLAIPYAEITAVRPTEIYRMFPPRRQNWSRRRFLSKLFGKTVIVIEMEELPQARFWFRLWMSKYMLCPDRVGLILAVRDWIAFRTDLDESRARRQRY
jgi:hypothetical protein